MYIMSETRVIKLNDIATWLTQATSTNDNFMLKPKDLKNLYKLVLWNYFDNNIEDPEGDSLDIRGDWQVTINEPELIRLVKIYYHQSYYPYFSAFDNM